MKQDKGFNKIMNKVERDANRNNNLKKIFIAMFGGIDAVVYIMTPVVLSLVFIRTMNMSSFSTNLFQLVGLLATVFRGYKIGWMKR